MPLFQNAIPRSILLTSLLGILLTPATAAGPDFAEYVVKPRNIIYGEDARQFVKRFRQIIKNKDLPALKKVIDEEGKFSFGGHTGVDDFVEMWELQYKPNNSKVWHVLQTLLDMGGVSEGGNFMMFPYLYADWPDQYDAFQYAAITGARVNLRAKPSLNGGVIRQMSYEIVQPIQQANRTRQPVWQKIQTHDQKIGYVSAKYVRSSIDYRVGFTKDSEGWKMTFFVAGD